MLPRIRNRGRGGDEIEVEQKGREKGRARNAARQRHENQRGAETGKPARRSRNESNGADGDGDIDADIGGGEANEGHAQFLWGMLLSENPFTRPPFMLPHGPPPPLFLSPHPSPHPPP